MGPFDRWAVPGGGFEYFYGFIGGETNQYYPGLFEGAHPVEPEKTPEEGYHFTEDMTDKAINWVRQQKALLPYKPFFVYFSLGATHAPHHVPKDWQISRRKFDQGWDELREETFARQKQLGVIPPEAELTKRDRANPRLGRRARRAGACAAREMEVYAGFLEHTDYHIGRLIDALADLEILDDTLIYYIIGDNGASAEGGPRGTFNEMANLNNIEVFMTTEFLIAHRDEIWRARILTTTMRWAGRMRWTRRINGPSRSPDRTGAARVTVPSSIGPPASELRVKCVINSVM